MEVLGIIPARYGSTRFPGKPLVMIGEKSMIQRVYEQSCKGIKEVYVATDNERIFEHVKAFGGNVVMTSAEHRSGTDRCREAMDSIISVRAFEPDVIVNIQGDEPFIDVEQIKTLIHCFQDPGAEIATLVKKAEKEEEIFDENKPKVVFDHHNFAMYFSRSVIPFLRGLRKGEWKDAHDFYIHIGIYAYRKETLKKITRLEISDLERAESLEQLRWLENGFKIKIAETFTESFGIDTPADLQQAIKRLEK
ncbi:MAG: 3-deoxy-manno-octulosonate cytidylyltransferase [Bacteroidota bacterium]